MLSCMVAKKIIVSGITQGVGFRPFVYRIATKYGLGGYVANLGGSEVEIHVEGDLNAVRDFLKALLREKPPPAEIDRIEVLDTDPVGFKDFKILPSLNRPKVFSQIPPDFAICDDCLREILDKRSRFYNYALNSCAWCGPRFSMLERIPYDRENTSMRDFPLCDECSRDYNDPNNIRRFHAQGISCPKCGPKLYLVDRNGEIIEEKDPIGVAARIIDEGSIVAIKGIGGFHIAALATDDDVVLLLRKRKKRPQKPFALMALDLSVARRIVYIDAKAEKILLSPQRPIVLLPSRNDSPVSKHVAPGLDRQGVMLAYTGIHYLLLSRTEDKFLIMTSGNRKNKPICKSFEDASKQLGEFVDYFLVHNRRIINRVDDSVVRFTNGNIVLLRRARGYAPTWIKIPVKLSHNIISLGAELQNAGAVSFEDKVILTQYVGDMDDLANIAFLEEALEFLMRTYRIGPDHSIIVVDKHPAYNTRRIAERWSSEYGSKIIEVQHHKAHICSVLAECGVGRDEKIVGIAMDGVGYGDDGLIWGGEVFYGKPEKLVRVGHLMYQPMPGGDLATRYPVRMLIGILSTFLEDWEIERIIRERGLTRGLRNYRELRIALTQARHPRCIHTSSTGRILDSVSAYLGICLERTYEGEPAIKLEATARGGKILDDLDMDVVRSGDMWIVNTKKLFEGLLEIDADIRSIAKTVQYLVGFYLGKIASKYLPSATIQKVYISGGAAVNDYIVRGIIDGSNAGIEINRKVPAGDGGIALGQIYLAGLITGDQR